MRCLARNKRKFLFAPYEGAHMHLDEEDRYTGEVDAEAGNRATAYGNISAAKGAAEVELFGADLAYDKIIAVERLPAGLNEYSMLWVDDLQADSPDYVVRRVAESLNHVLIAISKVSVSED